MRWQLQGPLHCSRQTQWFSLKFFANSPKSILETHLHQFFIIMASTLYIKQIVFHCFFPSLVFSFSNVLIDMHLIRVHDSVLVRDNDGAWGNSILVKPYPLKWVYQCREEHVGFTEEKSWIFFPRE